VVATANDLSLLPPELLRKGRFDEIFFVDLPTAGKKERETILRTHLGLRRQDATRFDLGRLATASEGFSGAELEATVPLSVTRREDIEQLRTMARTRFVPVA
jgi:SpoVK/Ycf46/Vps4 family AAA+-type ATPase